MLKLRACLDSQLQIHNLKNKKWKRFVTEVIKRAELPLLSMWIRGFITKLFDFKGLITKLMIRLESSFLSN